MNSTYQPHQFNSLRKRKSTSITMNTIKMVRMGMLLGLFLSHNVLILAEEFIVDSNGMLRPARGVGQSSTNIGNPLSSGEQHARLVDETVRRTASTTEEEDGSSHMDNDEDGSRLLLTRRHPKATTPKGNGYGNRKSHKSEAGIQKGKGSSSYAAPPKRGKGQGYKKGSTSKSEDGYLDQHRPPTLPPSSKHQRPYPPPTSKHNKGGYNWKQGPIFGRDESSDDDEPLTPKFTNCFVKVPVCKEEEKDKKKPIPKWKRLHKIRQKYGYGKGKGSGIYDRSRNSDDRGKGSGNSKGYVQQGAKDNHNRHKTRNDLIDGRHRNNGRQLWERPRRPEMTPWHKDDKDDSADSDEYYDLEDLDLYPIYCFDDDFTPAPALPSPMTEGPTFSPSGAPIVGTFSPTSSTIPSVLPSDIPSTAPSTPGPSSSPSDLPTGKPSESVSPSSPPSPLPTGSPSDRPSSSNQPSLSPTTSSEPSSIEPSQSSLPSEAPTDRPSGSPTDPPTETPSVHPTDSSQPSENPTNFPTTSNEPTITYAPSEPPSLSPTDTQQPSASPTDAPRCVVRSNLALCDSRLANFTELEECDCYNFCGDQYVGCCDFESECDIQCVGVLVAGCTFPNLLTGDPDGTDDVPTTPPPTASPTESQVPTESIQPTMMPTESNVPTESLVPTEMPSESPTDFPTTSVQPSFIPTESQVPTDLICSVTTNSQLCEETFFAVEQERIEGCDCYNYCNGIFNGCCAFGEIEECEQDCVGTVVSGCRYMTMPPTFSPRPSSSAPPSSSPTSSFPPTTSPMPSNSPTASPMPTNSIQPTDTQVPSANPTASVSPTELPSALPSDAPTIPANETVPGNETIPENPDDEQEPVNTETETVSAPLLVSPSARLHTRFVVNFDLPMLARTKEATLEDLSELEAITSTYLHELFKYDMYTGKHRNQHDEFGTEYAVTRIVGVQYQESISSTVAKITFRSSTEPTPFVVNVLNDAFATSRDDAGIAYLDFVQSLPVTNPLSLTTMIRLVGIVNNTKAESSSNSDSYLVNHLMAALFACIAGLTATIASLLLCWRREKRSREEALQGTERYEELKSELVQLEKQLTEAFEKRHFGEVKKIQKELAEKRQRLFARLDALDLLRRMKTGDGDEGDVETVASESQYGGF